MPIAFAKSAPNPAHPSRPWNKSPPSRLAANRANAQLSTGPTSASGRATSSQNRVSHGLARHNGHFRLTENEDSAVFDELVADLMAEHQPTTESILISNMVESQWSRTT